MKINIIGDIAGRYDEFLLLLEKMPEADLVLSVGDLVDRGPKSKQVIKWFMKQQKLGKAEAIYGNHEDMMVNDLRATQRQSGYSPMDWMHNGGYATLRSYLPKWEKDARQAIVPASHVKWLSSRPLYYQTDDLFVSHAPVTDLSLVPSDPHTRDFFFVWNRIEPRKPQSKYLIHGHNGTFKMYTVGSVDFGMCVDNSVGKELTGIHWPTRELFTQKYLEIEETPKKLTRAENKAEKEAIELLSNFII